METTRKKTDAQAKIVRTRIERAINRALLPTELKSLNRVSYVDLVILEKALDLATVKTREGGRAN